LESYGSKEFLFLDNWGDMMIIRIEIFQEE